MVNFPVYMAYIFIFVPFVTAGVIRLQYYSSSTTTVVLVVFVMRFGVII